MRVFPCHHDPLANDVVLGYVRELEIDAVITFVDVWKFNKQTWSAFPCFPYCPIDHQPTPPAVADFLQAIKRPIAMSKFGVEEMRKLDLDPLYMPLAVDPSIFYPQDKGQSRRALGLHDDAFIATFIGVNDSNPSRKGIPELLCAWKMFSQEHPDAKLYLHTLLEGNLPMGVQSGVRIDLLIQTLQIDPSSIYMPNQQTMRQHVKQSTMAQLMNASDVLIQPSRGEGFGVPIIEAQACGTPVITTNFAAQANHVHAGWLIEGEIEWGWQNSFVMKPGILSIIEALESAYQARGDSTIRQTAIDGAANYHIDTVIKQYTLPVIEAIASDVLDSYASIVQEKVGA